MHPDVMQALAAERQQWLLERPQRVHHRAIALVRRLGRERIGVRQSSLA